MQSFAEFIAESFYSEVVLIWRLRSTTYAVAGIPNFQRRIPGSRGVYRDTSTGRRGVHQQRWRPCEHLSDVPAAL